MFEREKENEKIVTFKGSPRKSNMDELTLWEAFLNSFKGLFNAGARWLNGWAEQKEGLGTLAKAQAKKTAIEAEILEQQKIREQMLTQKAIQEFNTIDIDVNHNNIGNQKLIDQKIKELQEEINILKLTKGTEVIITKSSEEDQEKP